ncbi:hypothetical protein Trydic_g8075 [Trypoxylus dichotomus]
METSCRTKQKEKRAIDTELLKYPETQQSQRFYRGVAATDVLKRYQPVNNAQKSDDSSVESNSRRNHQGWKSRVTGVE